MCEVPGQVPCPSRVPIPPELKQHKWHDKRSRETVLYIYVLMQNSTILQVYTCTVARLAQQSRLLQLGDMRYLGLLDGFFKFP